MNNIFISPSKNNILFASCALMFDKDIYSSLPPFAFYFLCVKGLKPKMGKEIAIELRQLIIKHYCGVMSMRKIGEMIGKSKSSVQTVIRNYGNTGTLKVKPHSGRPNVLSDTTNRLIVRKVKENPKISAAKIGDDVRNELNIKVSNETIRNVLRKNNFHCRVARNKPLISKKNKRLRLEFAKEHENKGMDFWNRVIFSDESKFHILGCGRRGKVWRKPNEELKKENINPTVKHGSGNILLWGCVAASGVGKIHFIDSIMDKWVYLDILRKNLKESVTQLGLENDYIFQQDRDPKHTARIVSEWLLYHVPKQLNSLPQSPDMNPIENI